MTFKFTHIHKETEEAMQMHRPAGWGTIWQRSDQKPLAGDCSDEQIACIIKWY